MDNIWMRNESELDDFQHQVATMDIDTNLVVTGCAGSGKSIIALHKAKQISAIHGDVYYVIVFTKSLKQFIEDGIRELDLNPERVMYEHEWRNKNQSPSASYFIIDEAQDFNKEKINNFLLKCKKSISFYGDENQSIFDDTASIREIAVMMSTGRVENLQFNYRLPKKVARVAEFISPQNDSHYVNRCKREGDQKPMILDFNSNNDQLDYIINTIREKKLSNVGILLPNNKLVFQVENYLTNAGLTPEVRKRLGNDNIINIDFSSSNPKILTYHSAKGLQFNDVFLPFCQNEIFSNTKTDHFYQKPLYVAFTRTINNVYVLYSEKICQYLNKIPSDLYLSRTSQEKADF